MPLSCPRAPLLLLSLPSFLLPATPHGTKHNQRLSLSFALPLRRRRRRAAAARRARCLPRSSMLGRACHRHRGRPSASVRPSDRSRCYYSLQLLSLSLSLSPRRSAPLPFGVGLRLFPSLSFFSMNDGHNDDEVDSDRQCSAVAV